MSERYVAPIPPPSSRTNLRPIVRALPRTKTSIDIMNERDAFRARVDELEEALKAVQRESDLALRYSQLQLLTMCRISCIVRRAVGANGEGGVDDDESPG